MPPAQVFRRGADAVYFQNLDVAGFIQRVRIIQGARQGKKDDGSLREIRDATLKDGLVFVAGYVFVQVVSAALAVAHLAKNPSVRAGDALDGQHAAVRVKAQVHGGVAAQVDVLGGDLSAKL